MIYLLTVKEILILSKNIYLFTKSIIIRGNYILTRNYIHFKEPYQFVQGNIFTKEHIFVQVQGHMFIQGNYIYWTLLHSRNSRNIYSKIVPSHFMIIISFKITFSWIRYSYNFFLLNRGMKKLLIWSRVPYYNHCPCRFCYHRAKKYYPKCFPLPTLFLRQNLICPPASRLYLKELLNILQTVSSCSRYTTFFRFGSRFHRQNLPIPKRSPLRFTHFSNYDISQTHDWECPCLSSHVLLIFKNFVSRRLSVITSKPYFHGTN